LTQTFIMNQELEPPFTKSEKLGALKTERGTLEGVLGTVVNISEEKWSYMGKLWTSNEIVIAVEEIRTRAREGKEFRELIRALPERPRNVDIREVVLQIVDLDRRIAELEAS